jgi:RNA polymerase sigma-B factor
MAADDKILVRRYHDDGDLGAREELIERYMSLVRSLARRYAYRGEHYDDLLQVGTIGLIKAIDRFDSDRGVEFSTYATPTIVGETSGTSGTRAGRYACRAGSRSSMSRSRS